MRFALIDQYRGPLSCDRLRRLMKVTDRGFRAWRSRPASRRQRTDMVLLAHIREQFRRSPVSYGRPRMTEELKEPGFGVGHRRVGRLMQENGIEVKRNTKSKVRRDENLIRGTKFPDARPTAIAISTSRQTC